MNRPKPNKTKVYRKGIDLTPNSIYVMVVALTALILIALLIETRR